MCLPYDDVRVDLFMVVFTQILSLASLPVNDFTPPQCQEEVIDLKRHSGSCFVKLCTRFPDLLLVSYFIAWSAFILMMKIHGS